MDLGSLFIFLLCVVPPVTAIDLIFYLVTGRRFLRGPVVRVLEVMAILVPLLLLLRYDKPINDCCGESAYISPQHRLSAYALMSLCLAAYFYCSYRKRIAPPLTEVIVNSLLLVGLIMLVLVAIQFGEWPFNILLTASTGIFTIHVLIKNHRLMMESLAAAIEEGRDSGTVNWLTRIGIRILELQPLLKIPLLLVLAVPVLAVFVAILCLFGQRPDALVRAFTETYHHGLSQMDSQCDGVVCDGHFLCTIAAKGDAGLVRPQRYGVRAGQQIICNRQLLISNAFEEWLEQHLPAVHAPVRRTYNKVGDLIHRYYGAFNRKWVSNLIYVLMKPLEWIFLLVLYLVDRRPETRIAQQYMSRPDRASIRSRTQTG